VQSSEVNIPFCTEDTEPCPAGVEGRCYTVDINIHYNKRTSFSLYYAKNLLFRLND